MNLLEMLYTLSRMGFDSLVLFLSSALNSHTNVPCSCQCLCCFFAINSYPLRRAILTSILTAIFCLQASGCLGEDRGFAMRDCWCADHCFASACNSIKFQLLLSSWDRPRGDAVAKLQPCDQLPVSARHFRPTYEEELVEWVLQRSGWIGGGPAGNARPAGPKAEL